MNQTKIITGFCPTQEKYYSVSVNYLDASTLTEIAYIKGTARCEYNIFGDKYNRNECPIIESAPESL